MRNLCFLDVQTASTKSLNSGRPGTLGLSLKPGTVLGLWDCPKNPESRHHGVLFFSQSQRPRNVVSLCRVPKAWDSPKTLGMSLKPRTVPGFRNCPKDPESRHHGVLFLVKLVQEKSNLKHVRLWIFGTIPKARDSPGICGSLAESQKPGTVPGLQDCPKDPESRHYGVLFLVKLVQEK